MSKMQNDRKKNYFAEFIATFILVFVGTGAIVINAEVNAVIGHLGIAICFGLVVMAMIYAVGDISGAHMNPAVTIAFYLAKRFELGCVLPYILCQCAGAIAASVLLWLMFPMNMDLGGTLPSGSNVQSFIFEVVLTFILMFVILNVSTGAKEKGLMAGAAIGAVVGFEALFAGPVSGASMNPARSLGPAIVSGQLQFIWIYIVAPVIGAALAVFSCLCMRADGCCSNDSAESIEGKPL